MIKSLPFLLIFCLSCDAHPPSRRVESLVSKSGGQFRLTSHEEFGQSIIISSATVSREILTKLSELHALSSLTLSDCNIEAGVEFKDLSSTKLRTLIVRECVGLGGVDLRNLSALTRLEISGEKTPELKTLPPSELLHLRLLQTSVSKPVLRAIEKCDSLASLNLSGSEFSAEDLKPPKSLKGLNVSGTQIDGLRIGIAEMLNIIVFDNCEIDAILLHECLQLKQIEALSLRDSSIVGGLQSDTKWPDRSNFLVLDLLGVAASASDFRAILSYPNIWSLSISGDRASVAALFGVSKYHLRLKFLTCRSLSPDSALLFDWSMLPSLEVLRCPHSPLLRKSAPESVSFSGYSGINVWLTEQWR